LRLPAPAGCHSVLELMLEFGGTSTDALPAAPGTASVMPVRRRRCRTRTEGTVEIVPIEKNADLHREADALQATQWCDMLDREIDAVSAAIEDVEKRALAEHRAGAVDRARKFDTESA